MPKNKYTLNLIKKTGTEMTKCHGWVYLPLPLGTEAIGAATAGVAASRVKSRDG